MNSIYRSIWNEKTGTFVAVSESAMSANRATSSGKTATGRSARFSLKALAASLMMAFGANAFALPVGGVVTQGGASIASTASSTTITQSSQNVAINWQSFGIGTGQSVQFVQPNSSSVALNRVLGPDPSSILGNLSANGKVFLVNPNGILFGHGAQVNVGGLVASTLNISDGDFMAGNYQFSGNSGAAVLNQGTINAPGGYVALLGANVGNDGTILARLGTVALAAGNAMTLDVAGDGLLNVTVNQGAVNALAQNGGLIQADGGQVLLTAKSAGNLLLSAVNNTGVIQAQTIVSRNGTISLLGDMQSGTMNISGTLDVSGTAAGQTGGNVTVTGHHVGLFGARINASGDAGGGTVLIGGDYQGKNPTVQNATATYMSADSTINADAITNGNGGKVILWSDESTRAYGSITARGGASGGNGGLIETSAHWLDVEGIRINASAPNGKGGMWLLDPSDVTISLGVPSNDVLAGGVFTPTAGATSSNVNSTALGNALSGAGGTNITISTTSTGNAAGNITVVDAITWNGALSATGSTTLTLNAAGDVNINAAITATSGNLVVCCSQNITVAQLLPFPATQTVTTTNGSVLFSAGRNITIDGAMTTTDGNVAFCAGGDININGAMTLTRGTQVATESLASLGVIQGMSLSAGNAATGPGLAGGGGAVNINPAGGTITITQGGGPTTAAPVTITYNPLSYTVPATNFTAKFDAGTPITVNRLVFPGGTNKVADGTTTAVFTSFQPDLNGLVPGGGAMTLAGGTANYDTPVAGVNKPITYSGFTLGGASAGFALPIPCCGVVTRVAGTITPLPIPPVPPGIPPVLPIVPDIPIETIEIIEAPTFAAEEMMGEQEILATTPAWVPTLVRTSTPPQLLSVALPVVVLPPPPLIVPTPPPVYVPPVRMLKQDRN